MEEDRTKGQLTRSRLIEAAYQLFSNQGYHGTSMRQIAQHTGLALGGIYNHFDSKEDIFFAVLEAYHPYHEMLPVLQNAQGETIEAFVQDAAEGMVAALDRRPYFLNLMLIELVEFKSQHIPQMLNIFFPQVMGIVQRFAEKQENLRSIPLPIIVRTFIGLFFSYYLIESFMGVDFPTELKEDALDHAVDIFLHGIRNKV
jgi:AcrR family transcriptional regulator